MANNCFDTKLLSYNGTSQVQRSLDALLAKCALVDERTAADLILFTKKYSAWLNYYDNTNAINGDWQQLMGKDLAVVIASVAEWKTNDYTTFIKHLNDEIINSVNDTDAKNNFKILFDFIFSVVVALNEAYGHIGDDVSYETFLSVSIISKLTAPLSILYQYYNYFVTNLLIDPASTNTDPLTPVDNVVYAQNFSFSPPPDNVFIYIQDNSVVKLDPVFTAKMPIIASQITLSGSTVHDDINHILTHNLFTGALQSFIGAIINIVSRTPDYLAETLDNYPTHAPHYALYLTFLKLFGFAQQHLNQYTKKHLDFYYKQVLQLSNNAAEADFVHLVFELQKNIDQHLLPQGTSFKAGKDANNKDLFYSLTDDLVIQTAGVQTLKSLYLNKYNTQAVVPVTLYASPVANSEDGQGAKLLSTDSSWYPFGNPKNINPAAIGFAIASNVLYLNEGKRTITLTFTCDSLAGIASADLLGIFSIQLTGKKSWYTAPDYTALLINNTTFSLTVTMEGDAPAIVPYSAKIHGGGFEVSLPMVQVQLNSYASYQKIKIPRVNAIKVSVTVDAVKNLILQNDDGKINPAKPFKPFGDFPEGGASFIIGSKEIFQKDLTKLTIDFDWQQIPLSKTTVNISTLVKGSWLAVSSKTSLYTSSIVIADTQPKRAKSQSFNDFTLTKNAAPGIGFIKDQDLRFKADNIIDSVESMNMINLSAIEQPLNAQSVSGGGLSFSMGDIASGRYTVASPVRVSVAGLATEVDITGLEHIVQSPEDFTVNEDFTITAVDGYIKLELNGTDYSLSTFLSKIPQPSVKVIYKDGVVTGYQVDTAPAPVPDPPVLKSISVTYSAQDNIDFSKTNFDERGNFFYHLEPFGFREMHPASTSDALTVLPVFNLEDGVATDNGGELWIGLSNALPDETFSILFQVSEGSANPLQNMTQIDWYYLNNNNWLQFQKQSVTDQTNNLTRSGLVTVNVPADATLTNTRADSGLIWIKAVVQQATDAICNLIAIDANAAKAQFAQDIDKGIVFTQALAPNIISKPAIADAALKKTQQPYGSFDGRIQETDSQFYQRVSERLRHKHRAITTWDYERLILQYYPQVFKVKCLDHTGFLLDEKTNLQKYSEMLAGHVTVITIPDLNNLNNANPLRPYTSIGLLTEIEKYIKTLTSPFAQLHLSNPQFEEVQFDFSVTFHENIDPVYYSNLLSNEIEQFLTPWAFGNPQAIQFGNSIEKSVVLNFIEERPYVDFVTCFKMNHIIQREGLTIIQALYDIEEAIASTARSILVSYYNEETKVKHLINSPANCDCNG
ncbi:MAG: Baseplate J-like protein [Mucilaginibacter sp.]|nr:Baseplate J-like protein [Mucilaginibacter sp.]